MQSDLHSDSTKDSNTLYKWVDPRIGVTGEGACIIGPCLPNGSIHPSPQTLGADNGGYLSGAPVTGFAQLHAQGTGGPPSYGTFLVSAQIGLAIPEEEHGSPISNEEATCERYAATLDRYGIRCEVTPGHHAAIYRFTFPKSSDGHIVVDFRRMINGASALAEGKVSVDPKSRTMAFEGQHCNNWCTGNYPVFFVAEASHAFRDYGVWGKDRELRYRETTHSDTADLGAFCSFCTDEQETVVLRVAVSFKSLEQARKWLRDETGGTSFGVLSRKCAQAWNQALRTLAIDGVSDEERRFFYTALYHTMVQPRDRTADKAGWDENEQLWDDHYTLWDTWRTLFPLMALIRPDIVRDNVMSFVNRHIHNGIVHTAFTHTTEGVRIQGGDEADNIIADAFVKGVPGIDWEKAYGVLEHHAENARSESYRTVGYLFEGEPDDWRAGSGSSTLAMALNDFCAAQVAKGLGKDETARRYYDRSGNWGNVWNKETTSDGFTGFVIPRLKDGSWMHVDPKSNCSRLGYYEGGAWIYSFFVPHDIPAMIDKMGGEETFVARLNHACENDLLDLTNEPCFLTMRLFNYAGRPDLCSKWVRIFLEEYTADGYPGDDDAGAMSSMYLFTVAGLFPNAGQAVYLLNGPRFPRMGINLPGAAQFTIIGENAGPNTPYVAEATLNNEPLDRCWLLHDEIVAGGTLRCVMSQEPTDWAKDGPRPPCYVPRDVEKTT